MQKVFDCFPFYNELDLLEIRLNILNDVVDYFVLTESTRTFTGKPKPLYYNNIFTYNNVKKLPISIYNSGRKIPIRIYNTTKNIMKFKRNR